MGAHVLSNLLDVVVVTLVVGPAEIVGIVESVPGGTTVVSIVAIAIVVAVGSGLVCVSLVVGSVDVLGAVEVVVEGAAVIFVAETGWSTALCTTYAPIKSVKPVPSRSPRRSPPPQAKHALVAPLDGL